MTEPLPVKRYRATITLQLAVSATGPIKANREVLALVFDDLNRLEARLQEAGHHPDWFVERMTELRVEEES